MKRVVVVVGFALVGLMVGTRSGVGQEKDPLEMIKPGPEHKILASRAGTFEARSKSWFDPTKSEPEESTGVAKRKMILGGRYLQETFEGKVMGMPFEGGGLGGYDRLKKTYFSIWVDNMGTGVMHSIGVYDADKKAIIYTSIDLDPFSGMKMKNKTVSRIISEDEDMIEMYQQPSDGSAKERKVLEVRYTRKK